MAEAVKSVLNLERISFGEIQYYRDVNAEIGSVDYEMNFTKRIESTEDGKKHRVTLTANLHSKVKDLMKLKVTVVGFFYCECEDESLKNTLVNDNTIAILFPYLRSQISLVTTQPDLLPITFPPMNIVAMFHENE